MLYNANATIRLLTIIFLFCFVCSSNAAWNLKVELVAPGTRSEGRRGILEYNGTKITPYSEKLTLQDGTEYFYLEAKYIWNDAGWKMRFAKVPAPTMEIGAITTDETIIGHYYGEASQLKRGTPAEWVFLENKMYKLWISPERINTFLGTEQQKEEPFVFLTDRHPALLWHIPFFPTLTLSSDQNSFSVVGYESGRSSPLVYKIDKKTGIFTSMYPWPSDLLQSALSPSFTVLGDRLYYLGGSLSTGRFVIQDMRKGQEIFSERKYFTHHATLVVFNERIYLPYSEADHRFCHLEARDLDGALLWHFRSRESISEIPPLVDSERVIYFTNETIYCFQNR
ncbi:MAG: hypothetical protein PHW04_08760 [Candidatus Wallbacteria bacterium]|nr:hypothetical protein [Candidatus Wallbacteria bacterium]